jgi:hypothetical protein
VLTPPCGNGNGGGGGKPSPKADVQHAYLRQE